MNKTTKITVGVNIEASAGKVWKCLTDPHHIIRWNFASEDWHSPKAENDLKEGGKFNYRMEAKDGSFGFDFEGIFNEIIKNKKLSFTLADARKVSIAISVAGKITNVTETFEAETENSTDLQRQGWQAILNNFKKYVEST